MKLRGQVVKFTPNIMGTNWVHIQDGTGADVHGVTHMAAICAICKSQFTKVLPYYGMDMDMIVSVHQLVSDAIILTGQKTDDDEAEDESAA